MHSFQPSRGRILFEFVCALGMVASFVGAWKQTGASALLLAASVAGFYGFVRLLDLGRPRAATAAPQPEVEKTPEQADIGAFLKAVRPEPVAEQAMPVVEFAEVKQPAAEVSEVSEAKPRRKSGGRKAKIAPPPKVVELVPPVELAVAEPEPEPESEPVKVDVPEPVMLEEGAEFTEAEDAEFADFGETDETSQPHIAPLFEPEPFARMQRRAFGRRGRL